MEFHVMHKDCDQPVAALIEAYHGRDQQSCGTLDAVAYTCLAHIQDARQMWLDQNLTPYTVEDKSDIFRCGSITDFRDPNPTDTPA
ncbi:hypothetical protein [Streptomyces sp. NPDC001205]